MNSKSLFSHLRSFIGKSPITLICQVSTTSLGAFFVLALAILVAGTSTPTASAQAVTYAGTGAVNFGSANVCPSGKTTSAPCSKTLTLTYNVTESGTLGTPQALTTGQPNLDYKLAGGGTTCSGSVVKGDTCKVNVAFIPIAPGARNGAVEVIDSGGNVLATTYIYGNGVGPLIAFGPPALRAIGTGTGGPLIPSSIAVDASGNVFVADYNSDNPVVKELLAVNGSVPANPDVRILSGVGYYPTGVAVDGAGNIFFTDNNNDYSYTVRYPQYVREISAASGYTAIKTVGGDFTYPNGIAVDGSGNLFVTELGNYSTVPASVQEIVAAGGYTTTKTLGGSFAFVPPDAPEAVAVDSSGNLFVADPNASDGAFYGAIFEFPASGGYDTVKTIHVSSAERGSPFGVAVDPAGNLFAVFASTAGPLIPVVEFLSIDGIVPQNPAVQLAYNGPIYPNAIAVDGRGNILIHDYGASSLVQELQFSAAPALDFAPTYLGHISSDSPQSVQIQNQGNANLDATALSLNSPYWELVPGDGTPRDCAAGFSLVPGTGCNLSISFEPTAAGSLNGAVTIVDNNLNAPGSAQAIPLSGEGITFPPPQINSVNYTYGAPYSVVILYGANFGASQGSSTVTFNGIPTPHYSWANTRIYVTVPPTATTGNLIVTVNGEASNPISFTVLPQPAITGISPTAGPVGTVVTISGKNLVDYENNATVAFDNQSVPILTETSSAIVVAVPSGTTTSHFHILVNDTGMNSPTFTVTP
jgi:hypothetical protein